MNKTPSVPLVKNKPLDTIVYVDGFNLYYFLKNHGETKWLNIEELVLKYLDPNQHILKKIKYFTARVIPKKREKGDSSTRQNEYFRALKTINGLEIIEGKFKKREVQGMLVKSGKVSRKIVKISKYEEKESDVNIATHMLSDGYEDKYESAVFISNDTDLKLPLNIIRKKLKKKIIILGPCQSIHLDLKKKSTYNKEISLASIKESQFALKLFDNDKKSINCPKDWL